MQPYTLYVMSLSPYSDKIRMYLALKRLPVVEVRENMQNRERVLRARTGRTMVPVVITPDDRALNDSTAIVRALEAAHPEPAVLPADPGRRGFDALVEDYADEWVVRAMLASRWLHPADAEQASAVIAADMTCGAFGVDMATAKQLFPKGITATLPAMGATPDMLDLLLDDLRGLCADLDALFAAHRFLAGAEPGAGDLALYGQLNQIRRDPTGTAIVADPARTHLARWFRDLERRAENEAAEHPGTEPPDGTALGPLAARIAGTYLRFAVANARALEEAPKGPLAVPLAGGRRFTAARAGYNRKCLQALLGELDAALAAAGRLAGGAADRHVLGELAGLGPLLDPFPAVSRAARHAA
ncbi:MAG TPA: glutathione S-transferase family protein [Candidatus Binatia bacterium]|nr:glutathione S-transferase family protein [Candidatus Binatia bacterium]